MTTDNRLFFQNAINHTAPDARGVSTPVIRGTNSRIFIVDTNDKGRIVFRFNPRHVAHRNHDISKILRGHGIPVPDVDLHLFQGQYFETYPYVAGPTFLECLNDGMSKSDITETLAIMAQHIKKISDIPVYDFKNIENKNCSSVAQSNIVNKTEMWSLGQCIKYGTKLLNAGKQHVCHCDFTPQNIVLTTKNQASILDLNAVSIANLNFAVAIAGLALRHNKLNQHDFYDICDDFLPGQLQKKRLRTTERICELYFRGYCR